MKKISFYISTLLDDNSSISEFEKKIVEFCDLLNSIIDNNDEIRIPLQFYESTIDGSITVADYLFNPKYASPYRDLFFENIREYQSEDIEFGRLYLLLDEANNESYKALVGILENKFINEDRLYINCIDRMLSPHRFYLEQLNSLDEFKEDFKRCFPNLIFHVRIDQTINVFNNINEHSRELIRHLSILNDFAKNLYLEIGVSSNEIYDRLRSEYKIIASGRGSNEGLDKFLCKFANNQNELEEVRCNPHSKLYTAHSDYRIYFHWGRENIQNGKILIGHIGNHWDD